MKETTTLAPMTLRELFSVTSESLVPRLSFSLSQSPEGLDREKLRDWKSIMQSSHFAELVSEHVCGFLTASVAGVLAGAWHTYHELKHAGTETLADPALHAEVVLTDYEFSYDMSPSLDLLAGGLKLGEIAFDIEAQFTVHGLTLSLRHGCVDAIRSGKADCLLSITCAGSKVFTQTLAAVNLPGILTLPEPVFVAGQSRDRSRAQQLKA